MNSGQIMTNMLFNPLRDLKRGNKLTFCPRNYAKRSNQIYLRLRLGTSINRFDVKLPSYGLVRQFYFCKMSVSTANFSIFCCLKIDHSGSYERIVLEQNKFSQNLPLTRIEPATLGL